MPSRTKKMEIPPEIKKITISVGLLCPQDWDSRRCVRATDANSKEVPAATYFEKETEGISDLQEKEIVEQVVLALNAENFTESSRRNSPLTEGYHVWLERQ